MLDQGNRLGALAGGSTTRPKVSARQAALVAGLGRSPTSPGESTRALAMVLGQLWLLTRIGAEPSYMTPFLPAAVLTGPAIGCAAALCALLSLALRRPRKPALG